MTTHRRPRLPDAPWLLVAAVAIVAVGGVTVAVAGPDDQRYARDRRPDINRPTPVLAPGETGAAGNTGVPRIPREVAAARDDWPLPNHDYENTRATTTAEIDSSNVSELGVASYRELAARPSGARRQVRR
jgi:hypothetical protein